MELARETSGQFVGPMPIHEFMKRFMDVDITPESIPSSFPNAQSQFKKASEQKSEAKMGELLVSDEYLSISCSCL